MVELIIMRSFRAKIMCFLIAAMLFSAALSDFLIYRYTLKSQFHQLREKLITIAKLVAMEVDNVDLANVPLNKEGLNTPEYKSIHNKFLKIKNSIPDIKYLYVLSKSEKPGILKFIVDTGAGENGAVGPESYPGYEYDASRFPQMLEGFISPNADNKLVADEWGVFLSGYAPIKDTQGETIALLGVDMRAQDVYEVQRQVKQRAVYVLVLGAIMAILFGFVISSGITRQVRELSRGVQRVAQGELSYRVKVKGKDEIAGLARVFNQMTEDLTVYIQELKRTTAEKERLLKELEIAQRIQKSFLPESTPKIKGLDIAAINIPARMVSGDFYDFIPVQDNKWGLVIADVSGKGVPAALFMALSRTLLRASAAVILSPSEAVKHTNSLILHESRSELFVTLFYAVVDVNNLTFKYANAGHNPPILIRRESNDIVFLKAQGTPIGIYEDIQVHTDEFSLKKDDLLVLYTDGVVDAANANKEHFEIDRLSAIIRENRSLGAQEIMKKIEEEVSLFVGGYPQFDDITLMIIKAV